MTWTKQFRRTLAATLALPALACANEQSKLDSGPYDATVNDACVEPCFPDWCGKTKVIDAAFDASSDALACQELCQPDQTIPICECHPLPEAGASALFCQNCMCMGRVPEGMENSREADHFALGAQLEAASIVAFRRLRIELRAHGAPKHLLRASSRAARDEARHFRILSALARKSGASPRAPHVDDVGIRSIEALAVENAREGCVRETFGALAVAWCAKHAKTPELRAALDRLARDEARHAKLSHDVHAWAMTRLDNPARVRVTAARASAESTLMSEIETSAPSPLLPPKHVARQIVRVMC